jgi:molybdenum cofactor cytidylyltransferase
VSAKITAKITAKIMAKIIPEATPNIMGILLAAGSGTRFGGRKLEAPLRGAMLGLHAARALQAVTNHRIAIVTPDCALHDPLRALGYHLIINPRSDRGLSSSLILALHAARGSAAALVALADMPNVTPDHLRALIARFDGSSIVASCAAAQAGGHRSPPALLPASRWAEIRAQNGDQGARHLLQNGLIVECNTWELADVDTAADLDRLKDINF